MSSQEYEALVGIREVAKYLGLSPTHVRKMARLGQLPAINFSPGEGCGTWRFYISALAEFCQGQLSSAYAIHAAERSNTTPMP